MMCQSGLPPKQSEVPVNDRKAQLERFRKPNAWKSSWQLGTSVLLFCVLWTLTFISMRYSYWLTLLLALPTGGVLMRLFVLQHDCGHGSFFKSKRVNDVVGFSLGAIVLTPYSAWRRQHALHHATAGDLDRRGHGDVHTITVAEYLKLTPMQRFLYRLLRNPFIQFGVAPLVYFAVLQRLTNYVPHSWHRERAGIHWTNAILVFGAATGMWLLGFWQFILVHIPVVYFASSAGVWLFYVQHNFETTYWQRHDDWDFEMAAIAGSSYYQLPRALQWLTANIGFHHIHHLDSRIPNYRLQECFEQNSEFQRVPRLTLRKSLACASLKLFDEETGKMVGFRDQALARATS